MGCKASLVRALAGAAFAIGLIVSADGADYRVDLNYAGVDGAPYQNYAGAYKSIVAALNSSAAGSVPAGVSATSPNRSGSELRLVRKWLRGIERPEQREL